MEWSEEIEQSMQHEFLDEAWTRKEKEVFLGELAKF